MLLVMQDFWTSMLRESDLDEHEKKAVLESINVGLKAGIRPTYTSVGELIESVQAVRPYTA